MNLSLAHENCEFAQGKGTSGFPEPDPTQMKVLIGSGLAYLLYGGWVVARNKPRWMPVWLAALVSWFTLCKYLVCTRCERFGEACDFYYLGKWASRLFERQPDKTLDMKGIIAEGASVGILRYMPFLAGLKSPKMLSRYAVLYLFGQAALLLICCRRCVKYSKDSWKRETCPSYKMAERLSSIIGS